MSVRAERPNAFTRHLKRAARAAFLFLLVIVSPAGCASSSGGGGGGDISPLALPFPYTLGTRSLRSVTPGGKTIYISVGSFGAHFIPMSGDPLGDMKSNLVGLFARDSSELSELPGTGGNGDGNCDAGEQCGFWGGPNGEEIIARTPEYVSPMNATLSRVTFLSPPVGGYFGNPPHWEIQLELNSRFGLRIGHLAHISPELRDKILAKKGIDTDTYSGPVGNLFDNASIRVAEGEPLAEPQVFANEIPGQPGYFASGGAAGGIPWAQMEFTIGDAKAGSDVCVYDLMDPADEDAIQAVMEADMADPNSPRFGPYAATKWIWGAEGVLCPVYSADWLDYSSIHSRVGGWTERPEAGTTVDEWFAIVKIQKESAAYEASNYSSGTIDYLAARAIGGGAAPHDWMMPDGSTVSPFLAAGEVLEETDATLLVKWREIGWTGPVYQRAAFLLETDGLKIKWGDFASAPEDAVAPDLTAGEPCNDTDVICYDHEARL
jgi:hypothetical protein